MSSSLDGGDKRNGQRTVAVVVAILAALFLILYALSMGPMLWLSTHGYFSPSVNRFLSDLYSPLWFVARYIPFLAYALRWYISFWE